MTTFRTFVLFFFIQALYYGVLCWSYRAVAEANYPHIALSDLVAAVVSFTLIKKVALSRGWVALAGYVTGGVVGSLVSVWLTTRLF